MLRLKTQKYIEQRLHSANKNIKYDEYINKLIPYYIKVVHHRYQLEFSTKGWMTENNLDGSYCYSKKPWSSIAATPEWAAKLIICDNEETRDAFIITLGHEMAHKEKELCVFKYGLRYWRLIKFLNEIRADFRGAELMAGSNRQALITSCLYKRKYKEEEFGEEDNGNPFHPSWTNRLKYATYYDFNETLILDVAKDLKLNKKHLGDRFFVDKIAKEYKNKHVSLQPLPVPINEGDTD